MHCYIMVYYPTLIWLCIYLMLVIATVAEQEGCQEIVCPGPLALYEALGCTPIYTDHRCCAWKYDCDIMYAFSHSRTKCYFTGIEYKIGEKIGIPICEKNCTCVYAGDGLADFNCTVYKELCPSYKPSRNDCYQLKSEGECCSTEEYCPDSPELKGRTIETYENTYVTADYFFTKYRKRYICGESPAGSLECSQLKHWSWWLDVHAETGFIKKCAPVYLLTKQNVVERRRHSWRCQAAGDTVFDRDYPELEISKRVHGPLKAMYCPQLIKPWFMAYCIEPTKSCRLINPDGPPDITFDLKYKELCQFGQMTMHTGDELNSIEYDVDSCIVCACEVPPVPTCILLQNVTCQQSSAQKRSLFKKRNGLNVFNYV